MGVFSLEEEAVMDIYRFFHPHHNPRLHSTPLRQVELGELEQAAAELLRALRRANKRSSRSGEQQAALDKIDNVVRLAQELEGALKQLRDIHPGDDEETVQKILHERSNQAGWESWVSLFKEYTMKKKASQV